jgi:2-polyprenyl-3-methyl-5-hydroxy-6-metoxy-1,4-benzoquinol methylase
MNVGPSSSGGYDGTSCNSRFPHLHRVAAGLGIEPDRLVRAFEIERDFHRRILEEDDPRKRKEMYRSVYETVHPIYGTKPLTAGKGNPKDRTVRLFRRELSGKSILEVGCGNGLFLRSVARLLPHRELVGLDISTPVLPVSEQGIRFINADIIDFKVSESFDIVYSEHVIEHIAPDDLATHLGSLKGAMADDGLLIISAPNGRFGPSDVTRILDSSRRGRMKAMGTHLHEPTHSELMHILRKSGFNRFRTIIPFMKLRNYLSFVRLDAETVARAEGSRMMMGLLRALRFRGECIGRFDTVLICSRN